MVVVYSRRAGLSSKATALLRCRLPKPSSRRELSAGYGAGVLRRFLACQCSARKIALHRRPLGYRGQSLPRMALRSRIYATALDSTPVRIRHGAEGHSQRFNQPIRPTQNGRDVGKNDLLGAIPRGGPPRVHARPGMPRMAFALIRLSGTLRTPTIYPCGDGRSRVKARFLARKR